MMPRPPCRSAARTRTRTGTRTPPAAPLLHALLGVASSMAGGGWGPPSRATASSPPCPAAWETPGSHNYELSGMHTVRRAHNSSGAGAPAPATTSWMVADTGEVLSLDRHAGGDAAVWGVFRPADPTGLCQKYGCGFEGVTAVAARPGYLYAVSEGQKGGSNDARMFKLRVVAPGPGPGGGGGAVSVVDSCSLDGDVDVDKRQGVEAVVHSPADGRFYVGTRANDNVYVIKADTGGNELDDCKRAKRTDPIKFEAHFVGLSSLAFAPGRGSNYTLFAFFQNTQPSPAVVARSLSTPRAHPDVCFRVPPITRNTDGSLGTGCGAGSDNIEGIALVDPFDAAGSQALPSLVVDAAHDGQPYTVERLRLERADCTTLEPLFTTTAPARTPTVAVNASGSGNGTRPLGGAGAVHRTTSGAHDPGTVIAIAVAVTVLVATVAFVAGYCLPRDRDFDDTARQVRPRKELAPGLGSRAAGESAGPQPLPLPFHGQDAATVPSQPGATATAPGGRGTAPHMVFVV